MDDEDSFSEARQCYFGAKALAAAERTCRGPIQTGELQIDDDTDASSLVAMADGPLEIWYQADAQGRPPRDTVYVIGCAVSAGIGDDPSDNSVACVLDRRTGEQVAQYATSTRRFARIVVAMCRFFCGPSGAAYLIWKHNGPAGASFARAIRALKYNNIYKGIRATKATIEQLVRKPGWWQTPEDLADALDSMMAGWETGKLVCRDRMVIGDAGQYVWNDGKVEHSRAISGRSHGDRAVAMALAFVALRDLSRDSGLKRSRDDCASKLATAQRVIAVKNRRIQFLEEKVEWLEAKLAER